MVAFWGPSNCTTYSVTSRGDWGAEAREMGVTQLCGPRGPGPGLQNHPPSPRASAVWQPSTGAAPRALRSGARKSPLLEARDGRSPRRDAIPSAISPGLGCTVATAPGLRGPWPPPRG